MITEIGKQITAIILFASRRCNLFLNRRNPHFKKAHFINGQTAIELAIFGTIIMGVIGIMVTYSVLFNVLQQVRLSTFREALALSVQHDGSFSGPIGTSGGRIISMQDRTMPQIDSSAGGFSYSPFSASESVSASRLKTANPSWGNVDDLPALVVEVNGKRFQFTTANYKSMRASLLACGCEGADLSDLNCGNQSCAVNPHSDRCLYDLHRFETPGTEPYPGNPDWNMTYGLLRYKQKVSRGPEEFEYGFQKSLNHWWKWVPFFTRNFSQSAQFSPGSGPPTVAPMDFDCDGKEESVAAQWEYNDCGASMENAHCETSTGCYVDGCGGFDTICGKYCSAKKNLYACTGTDPRGYELWTVPAGTTDLSVIIGACTTDCLLGHSTRSWRMCNSLCTYFVNNNLYFSSGTSSGKDRYLIFNMNRQQYCYLEEFVRYQLIGGFGFTPDQALNPPFGIGIGLIDYQDGEVDFSVDSFDINPAYNQNKIKQGFLPYAPGAQTASEVKTALRIKNDENKTASSSRAVSKDIITRVFQLNPGHTGTEGHVWDRVINQTHGGNTVAVVPGECVTRYGEWTCFDPADPYEPNPGTPKFYIRSRLQKDKTTTWSTEKPKHCGNNICEPMFNEDFNNCIQDCHCGNGVCDDAAWGEDAVNCKEDCACTAGQCKQDAECPNGSTCESETASPCSGTCTTCAAQGKCADNSDCGPGISCIGGGAHTCGYCNDPATICKNVERQEGESCDENGQCRSGLDCYLPSSCQPIGCKGRCEIFVAHSTCGWCHTVGVQTCSDSRDCPPGRVCRGDSYSNNCGSGGCCCSDHPCCDQICNWPPPDPCWNGCATAADCDDGIPCTMDRCDSPPYCTHDDLAYLCDDGDPCTIDSCTEGGSIFPCIHTPRPDGPYCPNPGDCCAADVHMCTDDKCVNGQCTHNIYDWCDPEDWCGDLPGDCTVETCDVDCGCNSANLPDGTACAGGTCLSGVCQ